MVLLPIGTGFPHNVTTNFSIFVLKHAVTGNEFFHMGVGKEAYTVLQAGVLPEFLPPLTRCHTGPLHPVIT